MARGRHLCLLACALLFGACERSSAPDGDGGSNASGDGSHIRDFAYYDGKLIGCHDLSVCLGACSGNHDCEQDCYGMGATTGEMLYSDMLDCENVACPHMVPTDPCQVNNAGFPDTCIACKDKSVMTGGRCVAQAQACNDDL